MKLCGKMIRKQEMPEARPCFRKIHHKCSHSPDLTGLKNVFGYVEVLKRAKDYIDSNKLHHTKWLVLDKFGEKRMIRADNLFDGSSSGKNAQRGSGAGSKDKSGKHYKEYATIYSHYIRIFNKDHADYKSYKNMKFFDEWNPDKGGDFRVGMLYLRTLPNCSRPGYQLHVRKTKKHPFGFFGPGGIVWRNKMDRHDNDLLDLLAEWSVKKLKAFVKGEISKLIDEKENRKCHMEQAVATN